MKFPAFFRTTEIMILFSRRSQFQMNLLYYFTLNLAAMTWHETRITLRWHVPVVVSVTYIFSTPSGTTLRYKLFRKNVSAYLWSHHHALMTTFVNNYNCK